jgi:hypothetical protein
MGSFHDKVQLLTAQAEGTRESNAKAIRHGPFHNFMVIGTIFFSHEEC